MIDLFLAPAHCAHFDPNLSATLSIHACCAACCEPATAFWKRNLQVPSAGSACADWARTIRATVEAAMTTPRRKMLVFDMMAFPLLSWGGRISPAAFDDKT